jgi:hypothetical protein
MTEETAGDLGKGATRIGDLGSGDSGQARDRFSRDDGGGAASDRVIKESMPVCTQSR